MKDVPFSGIRLIFEEARKLEQKFCSKGLKMIHLSLGRPNFDTPIHIREAAKKALDEGFVHYTSNYGIPELLQAVAKKLKVENQLEVDPELEIIITVGANEAIFVAMLATLNPGDEVLIPDPIWLHYFHCAKLVGAKPVSVPCKEEHEFQLDPIEIEKRVTPKTKMIVLNTPCNPTGVVLEKDTLEAISKIAVRDDLFIISDEVYEKILYDGSTHYSIGSFSGMEDRTITVNSFSKTYSMTGWRIGYLAADKKIIESIIKAHQYTVVCAPSFVQRAAVAALQRSQDCVNDMVKEYALRRNLVLKRLNDLNIPYVKPSGAFYVFPNVKQFSMSSLSLARLIMNKAGVVMVHGSAFGDFGEGYVRLSYSASYEDVEEAFNRIEMVLKKNS